MRDTCANFKRVDYSVCLHPENASNCGYHVRTNEKPRNSKVTASLALLQEYAPQDPHLAVGHWVADEKPPVIESGLSPDPLAYPTHHINGV